MAESSPDPPPNWSVREEDGLNLASWKSGGLRYAPMTPVEVISVDYAHAARTFMSEVHGPTCLPIGGCGVVLCIMWGLAVSKVRSFDKKSENKLGKGTFHKKTMESSVHGPLEIYPDGADDSVADPVGVVFWGSPVQCLLRPGTFGSALQWFSLGHLVDIPELHAFTLSIRRFERLTERAHFFHGF